MIQSWWYFQDPTVSVRTHLRIRRTIYGEWTIIFYTSTVFPRESRGNCLICIFSKGGTWFAEAREITINIPNVTNIELLLSIDLLRQVDLTYHKKEKRKTTNSGSREACVLQACARGVAPCSSGCELWDASKTFLRKKNKVVSLLVR